MLRYLKKLEDKDIALNRTMIALGSCTMKLNATAEMIPISWRELAEPHPFVPIEQMEGYRTLFTDLKNWLRSIKLVFQEFHFSQMQALKVNMQD